MLGQTDYNIYSFNSLQTGRSFRTNSESYSLKLDKKVVSIPFKREGLSELIALKEKG